MNAFVEIQAVTTSLLLSFPGFTTYHQSDPNLLCVALWEQPQVPYMPQSLLLSSKTCLSTTLFHSVSLSPLALDARGLLSTALTTQAVVSTSPHVVCLVIHLWSHDISSRDSLPGDNLLKPVPGALKNLLSCCRTSHQNPQHLSWAHSTQPPPSSRSLFQDLVNQRATLGCDCSHGP